MAKALDYLHSTTQSAQLVSASTNGQARIDVIHHDVACFFLSFDAGRTWSGDHGAVVVGLIDRWAEPINASLLTDQLQDIYSRGLFVEPEPEGEHYADPDFVFDTEMRELESMLGELKVPDGYEPPPAHDPANLAGAATADAAGISVLGRSAGTPSAYFDIASGDGQVLRRSAGAMSWGALDLANVDDIEKQIAALIIGSEDPDADLGLTPNEAEFFKA